MAGGTETLSSSEQSPAGSGQTNWRIPPPSVQLPFLQTPEFSAVCHMCPTMCPLFSGVNVMKFGDAASKSRDANHHENHESTIYVRLPILPEFPLPQQE